MWKRATWHECAEELDQICGTFRAAYWGRPTGGKGWPRDPRDEAEMRECSRAGVQLLRALALAVRSEQDFGLVPAAQAVVGAFKRDGATPTDARDVKTGGGYTAVIGRSGWAPLHLREGLNKIAHADPGSADYYVGALDSAHDLLLYGANRGQKWFAALSLLELVRAIRALPDAKVVDGGPENP